MAYTKQAGFFYHSADETGKKQGRKYFKLSEILCVKKNQPKTNPPRLIGERQSALNPIKTALNKISTGF